MRRFLLHTGAVLLVAVLAAPTALGASTDRGNRANGAPSAVTGSHPVQKRKINLPPSADLRYAIEARQSGLQIQGDALVQWRNSGSSYSIAAATRAMLVGKILDARSEGAIDGYGLAPATFTEKRFRKEATSTTFDRSAKAITFGQSDARYPLLGGEQDRTSVTWQLISVARAQPKKFIPGSEWSFFVAGQRDAERWSFKVVGPEKIHTAAGEISTLHVVRAPPPDAQSQKLDLWLAPTLEWYPVRLRFTDADGEYIEQTLQEHRRQ